MLQKDNAVVEHLVNNLDYASNYNLKRFKIIKCCFNNFDLIKLEAVCSVIRNINCVSIKILIKLFLCFYK